MTSSVNATNQDGENVQVKENSTVTTLHKIYREDNENIILRDPINRRSFINRPAYAKLHRTFSSGNKRHSVDNLKGRFENLARQSSQDNQNELKNNTEKIPVEAEKTETDSSLFKPSEEPVKTVEETSTPVEVFTPATFGYPKTAKLTPPLIKPKPTIRKRTPKDVNSNVVARNSESSDAEEVRIVLQPTASQESVDKIAKELSNFTMDGKPKDRKRVGSFKKIFGFFGKEKKKKEDERIKQKSGDSAVYNDNFKNESNFNRQSPLRQTVPNEIASDERRYQAEEIRTNKNDRFNERLGEIIQQEVHERRVRELEQQYAQLHVNRFNSIRKSFNEDNNYVISDKEEKAKSSINDYISTPVNKYIDTSSSASVESEKPNGILARDTPPRAQETFQNIQVVKPKAANAINLGRHLPNPYQPENDHPRTIERNLNRSNSKDFPDKSTISPKETKNFPEPPTAKPKFNETYGTVFDSLDYAASRNGDVKQVNVKPPQSPSKLPSLESIKLRLPPNREIYEPQPRVKSPIPTNRVSTDKIIATELLKNTRSPTPPKRVSSIAPKPEEAIVAKPPISPKSKIPEPQFDRIVTNALVHSPKRLQAPTNKPYIDGVSTNKPYIDGVPNMRASTPVDLRMSVSLKMSPKKQEVRKSVEEYYWKELRKMKDEEDSRLLQMNGYYEDQSKLRRSRSLSPHRAGRRSLSLPRDGRGPIYADYVRVPPPQPIPEDQIMMVDGRDNRRFVYDQNFIRNNPERRSVDSLQRPIFRRGSLTKQEIYEATPYNKRVSFGNQATQQAWPTRNGYTQSPPQRRMERMDSDLDDEVFVQNQADPIYGNRYVANDTNNRVVEQFRAVQYENLRQQQLLYGQVPPQMGVRRLSMDSLPRQQEIYVSRGQPVRRPLSTVPQVEEYGRINVQQRYPSNSQLSLQRNPVYSSRQSITDANYGQKQITVRNKYCDIYGRIHDAPQSGTLMGQLSPPMIPDGFVRGSRLTASANDIGKRHNDPNYDKYSNGSYDNRPLPPPPRHVGRNPQISDTESGSEASEIQRIMQNKTKKRGLFGK